MDHSKTKVAVVGGGPGGMSALKELREVGFDVTLFERRKDVGGVWTFTEDRSMTTALRETRLCNVKFGLALSDFPIPPSYATHLSAPEMGSYLRSYAKNFDLYKNIEFGKNVTRFEKGTTRKWQLTFADEPNTPKQFDKVVWATGGFVKPKPVAFEGQEQFAGRIIHSTEVRNIEDFNGQSVIVLGIGNTAGDITIAIQPRAKKVYISHRRGTSIMRRLDPSGLPTDIILSPTVLKTMWWIDAHSPSLFGKLTDMAFASNFKGNWGENKPEWGFAQAPTIGDGFHTIVCNDDLIPLVKEGKVTSTKGIKRIVGPKSVEMDDGSVIDDVDTIIAAVGFYDDMGMMADALTFVDAPGGAPLPDLYMGLFPPEHADSLILLSNVHDKGPQIPGRELAGMAVAQIWAGKSSLPSKSEMDAWVHKHQQYLRRRIQKSPSLHRGEVVSLDWNLFLHDMAGTGLFDNIGWSWKAWKLWWSDRELYNLLAHGIGTPHAFRVFETGKRTAWKDARQAIVDVNEEIKRLKQAAKETKMS